MKKYNYTSLIIIFISLSFLQHGCYMFFTIPSEEKINQEREQRIKIVFNNDEELVLDSLDNIIMTGDSLIIFQNDSTRFVFSRGDVKKIMEEKFSFGKSFFATFWISILILFLTIGIVTLVYGPIRIG